MDKLNRKPNSGKRSPRKNTHAVGATEAPIAVHPALCASFGYCMVKTGIYLRALMDAALVESNIVAPQVSILTILNDSGPMSQIEIGTVLTIDKATVVKLIDGLEQNKYVTRINDKSDRRIKRVQISAAGKRIKDRALQIRGRIEQEALEGISTSEREFLMLVMPKLLSHVRDLNNVRIRSSDQE